MVSLWKAPYHESSYESDGNKRQVLKYYQFEVESGGDDLSHKQEADKRARQAGVGTPRRIS